MKKIARILSVALVAAIILSVASMALAEDLPTVFIPAKQGAYDLPELPEFIMLKTKANDEKIDLYFSEKPDWGGVLWGSPEWAWEDLSFDDDGHAVVYKEGHANQPGKWAWSADFVRCVDGQLVDIRDYDPRTDTYGPAPDWAHSTGDSAWAFQIGKGNVTVQYKLSGVEINAVILKVEEDYYETGLEGASTEITFTPVFNNTPCFWADAFNEALNLALAGCNAGNFWYVMWDQYQAELDWYVSSIKTTYPEGSPFISITSNWRNDKRNTVYDYVIEYPAEADNALYRVRYDASNDAAIKGEYVVDGSVKLTTGSKSKINSWFGDRAGGRASKKNLRKLSSFPSPRVK